jgi:formamidopyrimidine-DNA glycosylase
MPELPEVETIVKRLTSGNGAQPSLVDLTVQNSLVLWERTLAEPNLTEFHQRIIGQHVAAVSRRGKYLVFSLSADYLIIHLRMSGDILIAEQMEALDPYARLVIDFEHGLRMTFQDPRKFGRAWLVAEKQTILGALGPEPLDETFTPNLFYKQLHRYRRQIKPLLLDQTFLAGMGNIYTDEALHMAKIHPLTRSDGISFDLAQNLLQCIQRVLRQAIDRHGTSIDWIYRGGDYQRLLRVYGRTGSPCPDCASPVERIKVGQRGTHFCPVCQPAPA